MGVVLAENSMGASRVIAIVAWAVIGFASVGRAQSATQPADARRANLEMAAAAEKFFTSLRPEQQAKVVFNFTDDERKNWNFTPVARKGLAWKEMTPEQSALGRALVRSGLSQNGYEKTEAIQKLEIILKALENGAPRRDPENYYISLFGKPGSTDPWGWRFEGHHIALNFTIAADGTTTAPAFLGVNPAKVPDGPQKDMRILSAEEDLGRKLVSALSADQKKIAIIEAVAPREILTTNSKKLSPMTPAGITADKLDGAQRAMLMDVIKEYTHRMRPELANQEIAKMESAGIDKIHFAWAGPIEVGAPHYYRIQGPTFLIEYDDTQNNANHIHSVWRDPANDFGEDLLRKHYATSRHD